MADYNSKCVACGARAYVGLTSVECEHGALCGTIVGPSDVLDEEPTTPRFAEGRNLWQFCAPVGFAHDGAPNVASWATMYFGIARRDIDANEIVTARDLDPDKIETLPAPAPDADTSPMTVLQWHLDDLARARGVR